MLGLNPDELMLSPTLSGNTPGSVKERIKKLNAATKLSVCMMAWNKQDDFKPDETANYYQEEVGYTPYFHFKNGRLLSSSTAHSGSLAGLVSALASPAADLTSALLGLRLCFNTRNRAIEFGKTFIDIFNELI